MLTGAHVVIYSKNAEADRTFFKDILGLPSVDAGHGWLIFALPVAEVAFHPQDDNNKHEMYFTCDDLKTAVADLRKKRVQMGETFEERWGTRTTIWLPGGGTIGLYQPKHPVTFPVTDHGSPTIKNSDSKKTATRKKSVREVG